MSLGDSDARLAKEDIEATSRQAFGVCTNLGSHADVLRCRCLDIQMWEGDGLN